MEEQGLVRPQRGKEGQGIQGRKSDLVQGSVRPSRGLARCVWALGVVPPCRREPWLVKGLPSFGRS